jgi:drug/metabolite transporter (DMT)-like permease
LTLQLHLAALVLLAAFTHATWNAVVKISGERLLIFTVMLLFGFLIGAAALPFVGWPAAESWPFLLASVVIHNGYYVFLLLSYRHGDLSQVYPLARGSAPLLIAVLAAVFAAEIPGIGGAAGIGLVSLGIISLAFADGMPKGNKGKSIALALITGLFIAGYTVVDGLGMRKAGAPFGYIAWLNILEGIPFLVAVAVLRRRQVVPFLQMHWKTGAIGGALATLSYALVLYALSLGAMAHVSALRETSVLIAALIGTLKLGESFGVRRIAAAATIVAGMILLQVMG